MFSITIITNIISIITILYSTWLMFQKWMILSDHKEFQLLLSPLAIKRTIDKLSLSYLFNSNNNIIITTFIMCNLQFQLILSWGPKMKFSLTVICNHLLWKRLSVLIRQVMLCSAEEWLKDTSVTTLLLRITTSWIEPTLHKTRFQDHQILEMAPQVLLRDNNNKFLTLDLKMSASGNQVYNKYHNNINRKTTLC